MQFTCRYRNGQCFRPLAAENRRIRWWGRSDDRRVPPVDLPSRSEELEIHQKVLRTVVDCPQVHYQCLQVCEFFENLVGGETSNSLQIIVTSGVPTEVRTASQILALLSNQSLLNDDVETKGALAEDGPTLIQAIFRRVQSELMRPTVEALAEVLFFYFKEFTTETRCRMFLFMPQNIAICRIVLNGEAYGSSQLVTAMFREIGSLRNFKKTTIRFNNAAIRDPGSV